MLQMSKKKCRSNSNPSRISSAVILMLAIWKVPTVSAQSATQAHLQQAITTNSLEGAGKTPFHIKIAFQLSDLAGIPVDTGSVEEWWASAGISRVVVTATSLKTTEPVLLNDELVMDPREKYLVQKLLVTDVQPFPHFTRASLASMEESTKTFDKTVLTCFNTQGKQLSVTGAAPHLSSFCADPLTYTLRMMLEDGVSTTARNNLRSFHGVQIPMMTDIAYENLQAISGKVTVLQSFDPTDPAVLLPKVAANKDDTAEIVPGKNLTHVSPYFPPLAKASKLAGSVVLHAVISKQGTTKDVFILASRRPIFNQSAIDAVRQWTYKPFLSNGQPMDVDTVISCNFYSGG